MRLRQDALVPSNFVLTASGCSATPVFSTIHHHPRVLLIVPLFYNNLHLLLIFSFSSF
jgi:hypothetical protein